MFLNRLKKKEKIAFLELAHFVARSDNDFSKHQQEIIQSYCQEMQINNINYKQKKFSLDKTLSKVKLKESQKIILLEIMALVYSDDILHKEEKKILDYTIKKFGLDSNISLIYAQWSKAMLALTIQGEALLHI